MYPEIGAINSKRGGGPTINMQNTVNYSTANGQLSYGAPPVYLP